MSRTNASISPGLLFAVSLAGLCATTARGANKSYACTNDIWHKDSCWSPSGIPGSADNVTIPSGKTCTIENSCSTCPIPATVLDLTVSGSGTLKLNSWNLKATGQAIIAGNLYFVAGNPTLTTQAETTMSGNLYVQSNGTVSVAEEWAVSGDVEVNSATLTIVGAAGWNVSSTGSITLKGTSPKISTTESNTVGGAFDVAAGATGAEIDADPEWDITGTSTIASPLTVLGTLDMGSASTLSISSGGEVILKGTAADDRLLILHNDMTLNGKISFDGFDCTNLYCRQIRVSSDAAINGTGTIEATSGNRGYIMIDYDSTLTIASGITVSGNIQTAAGATGTNRPVLLNNGTWIHDFDDPNINNQGWEMLVGQEPGGDVDIGGSGTFHVSDGPMVVNFKTAASPTNLTWKVSGDGLLKTTYSWGLNDSNGSWIIQGGTLDVGSTGYICTTGNLTWTGGTIHVTNSAKFGQSDCP